MSVICENCYEEISEDETDQYNDMNDGILFYCKDCAKEKVELYDKTVSYRRDDSEKFSVVDFTLAELKRLKELGLDEETKIEFIKHFLENLSDYSLTLISSKHPLKEMIIDIDDLEKKGIRDGNF